MIGKCSWAAALVLALTVASGTAWADSFQGFETDASGWFDNDDYAGFGVVTRVPSGTDGIASSDGSWHANFAGLGSGSFTRFDGYRDTWTGTWTACADVYLDTTWASGSGFDYSVAANGSDDAHQRDFIFHVAADTSTGNLLVAASNNTNFATREDLDTLSNHYVVNDSGWYTMEHVFYDNGGQLAVDLNLRDSGGTLVFSETRTDASDLIPGEVGGNRYGWFTFIDVQGGIAVDNTKLNLGEPVPEPTTVATLGLGIACLVGLSRRRRRSNA